MHIELRHLRYFLAVAEELNFSRAAERLHIAQPALSAQIRALETRLGSELFIRTTRKVELTPTGRLFALDARDIVQRADAAFARAEAAARGERGTLRIGFFVHGAAELGMTILRRFAERFPSVEVETASAGTLEDTQRSVRDHDNDVAFVWLPLLFPELEYERLESEQIFVAVSRDHRLAARSAVGVDALRDEPLVAPWEQNTPDVLAYWFEPFRPQGRRGPKDLNGKDHDECLLIAVSGAAFYLVPEFVARFNPRPDLVYRPVVGVPRKENGLVWHHETRNAAVRSFLEVAREVRDLAEAPSAIKSSGS
jgi:DNA-binding transcriptional LysR family regulator